MDPAALPSLDLTLDAEAGDAIGLPGLSPQGEGASFSARFDKRDDFDSPSDCGWIGESADGVWICEHPLASLVSRYPELWDVWVEYASGQQELTERDWIQKSAFEYQAKMELRVAANRQERKRMKSNG